MFDGDEDDNYLKGGGAESMGLPLSGFVLYESKWSVGRDFVIVG
jgi:hypothetical protein